LDAGTYGTMGVGLGFAIAAAVVHPGKKIVAVEGDSAFGFSGLELECACRFKLPIIVIIINNNGIYQVCARLPFFWPLPRLPDYLIWLVPAHGSHYFACAWPLRS
jgi:hypothetical protein